MDRHVRARSLIKSGRHHIPLIVVAVFAIGFATDAAAQGVPSAGVIPPAIGTTIPAEALRDLPVGENVYAVLETTQPEVIADSFNSGGLNAGQPARVGGFFGSWSQTVFRIGDVDVSDPTGTGSSLLFPETFLWQRVDIATGQMPVDLNTSSLAVTMQPRRPTATWTGTLEGSGAGNSLVSSAPASSPPPIVQLHDWAHGDALVSGSPVPDRVGIVAGGSWTRSSRFERTILPETNASVASGFATVIFAPSQGRELRTFGWIQRAEVPFGSWATFNAPAATTRDVSTHVQATWEQAASTNLSWRVFGGFTERSRADSLASPFGVIDRLVGGPVIDLVDGIGDTTVRRWQAGTRVRRAGGSSAHVFEFGADAGQASAAATNAFSGSIGEMLATTQARLWTFTAPGIESRRTATTIAAFASDSIAMSPTLNVNAALRFESVTGNADGAATSVSWRTLLPRASARWEFAAGKRIALVTGYSRTAPALNLNWLAYGDPAAVAGGVSAWPANLPVASAALVAPFARVGPGARGNPPFSGIDPNLSRPHTDEFIIGVESRRGTARFGMTGIVRREANLMGVVNTGVPSSSYGTLAIPDAGIDLANPSDDRPLTVYNRLPASFNRDAYLVTNPGQDAATLYAVKLTAEASTDRLFLLFGGTAAVARGSSASRGYGPLDNDHDRPGELFTDPNAANYAFGRLFSDRAFTIKWTTVYRFAHDFRLGAIARYQDGQPFARMVIVSGLNQGPEAVRAYPNGGSRFTYTGTLDLRLQKGFGIGPARLDAIVDLYNLLTRSNEVEEFVVSGSAFRTPTAIEPTPAVHIGFRVAF